MASFSRVRDIIDHYENFLLPIIKKELAACQSGNDYVYGKTLRFKGFPVTCCDLSDRFIEMGKCKYKYDVEQVYNLSSNEMSKLYDILHSNNITFTSPHAHQKRWHTRLNGIVNDLEKVKIQSYRFINFEHLYDIVRTIFMVNRHPNAILTIYDTALRIGYNHSEPILPSKFVYLYGNSKKGPKSGAINLYGQAWVQKNADKDYEYRIKTRWFNDKFPNLPSWEIESILCIYAKYFYLNMPY